MNTTTFISDNYVEWHVHVVYLIEGIVESRRAAFVGFGYGPNVSLVLADSGGLFLLDVSVLRGLIFVVVPVHAERRPNWLNDLTITNQTSSRASDGRARRTNINGSMRMSP
jgi:hypothetical protein